MQRRARNGKPYTLSNHIYLVVALLVLQSVVLRADPNDRIASITSALRNREFDTALQLLQPALQTSPNSPQLWMLQGLAYSEKGDQHRHSVRISSALKIAPDYLPALEGAAQLEYEAGSADAVPLLEHVLRLRPQDPTSHAMLGGSGLQKWRLHNRGQSISRRANLF